MATIDKAVELLEKVLEENYKLSEGYEIKPETRDEIEEWIKWYNDYKKRGEADNVNENSGLHLQRVSNSLPTPEEIEIKYPCEVGQSVIMEADMSYDDTIKANYYRRQGAKWLLSLLGNDC